MEKASTRSTWFYSYTALKVLAAVATIAGLVLSLIPPRATENAPVLPADQQNSISAPPGLSAAEIERDIERARRETLEKAMKEFAAGRPEEPRTDAPEKPAPDRKESASERSQVDEDQKETRKPAQKESALERKPPSQPQSAVPPTTGGTPPLIEPCVVAPPRLERPLPVSVGSQVCSGDGLYKAIVLEISSYYVRYSVPGRRTGTCRKTELCSFDWERGAPLFNIDIVNDGAERRALLIDAR